MKNNKQSTYLLLVVVAIVWGLIFYRIFIGLRPSSPAMPQKQNVMPTIYTEEKNTHFELFANYRDPFLGKVYGQKTKPTAPKPPPKKIQPKKIVPPIPKSNLKLFFLGLVSSSKYKKKVGFIRYNNKEQMIEEGEQLQDITIVRFTKDSMLIKHTEGEQWVRK